ncbi:MAG: hypothetical protein ACOVOX_13030, partial [Burkholderiaceae bacterium]
LFVTLVATPWFNDYHEWQLALAISAVLAIMVLARSRRNDGQHGVGWPQVAGAMCMLALLWAMKNNWHWQAQPQ